MLGQELLARRKGLRLTQEKLAQKLGITTTTLARWERGEVRIQHPEMMKFALEAIERELAQMTDEERHQNNLEQQEITRTQMRHERRHKTPERDVAQKWFGKH